MRLSTSHLSAKNVIPFVLFLLALFSIQFADAMLSYISPVVIESKVKNYVLMGVIISFSSLMGIASDIFFARFFPGSKYRFFGRLLFVLVAFFPVILYLFPSVPGFLLAMAVWGVYFEALTFLKFHVVHALVPRQHHGWAWGILELIHNIALVSGPFLTSLLLDRSLTVAFGFILVFCVVGAAFYFFFEQKGKEYQLHPIRTAEHPHPLGFRQQLKVWGVYEKILWPLFGLLILMFLVDTSFLL